MADETGRAGDLELLLWLVDLGQRDREQYRVIRRAMWAMFVENAQGRSPCSDIPSIFS